MALILDSGVLYALLDRRDASHPACRDLVMNAEETLVIPSPVLIEVDYFITQRLQTQQRLDLLDDIRSGGYLVENLLPEDYERVFEICSIYNDADVGFVDAAVLAIVERFSEPKLATLDRRHFGMMRPHHVAALRLLP
ncbi:MAG TPA: PIN domain-containing protein [Dehalococcoidia bacterium]|nr:PIN domain-containing protein [Dehalococcoidia bacterium]